MKKYPIFFEKSKLLLQQKYAIHFHQLIFVDHHAVGLFISAAASLFLIVYNFRLVHLRFTHGMEV